MSTLFGANKLCYSGCVPIFDFGASAAFQKPWRVTHHAATVTTNRPLPQLESNQSLCLFQALMHGQVPAPQIRVDSLTACYIWSQTCALESSCIAELYAGGYGGWSRAFHVMNQETGLSWNSVLAVEHQKLIAECFATNHDRTLFSQTGFFSKSRATPDLALLTMYLFSTFLCQDTSFQGSQHLLPAHHGQVRLARRAFQTLGDVSS